MDSLSNLFWLYIGSTITASVVIVLVMAIRKIFRKHLNARILHILWLIVLIRLLVPVFPNSPVSIFHLFQIGSDMTHLDRMGSSFFENELVQERLFLQNPEHSLLPDPSTALNVQQAGDMQHDIGSEILPSFGLQIISAVWIIGVLLFTLYITINLYKMKPRRRSYEMVTDFHLISIINQCRDKLAIKKPLPVYTGNDVKSPYIAGIFNPWIYIPKGFDKELSTDQLFYVFSHELAHLKRRDIIWNVIGSFALAIHWFNPLVWVCMKQMKADRELACDAYTLNVLGEKEAIPYGMTIIACLRNFTSKRTVPSNSLFFYESNDQEELKRRIQMIKLFKKGSYKLSMLAVSCIIIVGIVTLTNAGTNQTTASSLKEDTSMMENQVLFDSTHRMYGTLEKAVNVSSFPYKVPELLPSGFQFDGITLDVAASKPTKESNVSMRFEKRVGNTSFGSFNLTVIRNAPELEAVYSEIKQNEVADEFTLNVKKERFDEHGVNGIKITAFKNNWEKLYYMWQDEGILYLLEEYTDLTAQDLETMIASLKYPDQKMFERYVNHDLFTEYIYDTEDLERVPESIGFNPKFPLQLPEGFEASTAFETRKVNFSHPEDEEDRFTRLLYITYTKKDENGSRESSFSFKQIKNNHLYENMKKNGGIAYSRIDGIAHEVRVTPLEMEGKEVLVTEKYKIDGPLSSANAPDHMSYFWKEDDVCFQVTFSEDSLENEKIVSALINEKYLDINDLKL